MNVFELVDEHYKMQQGGKYPPISNFYKDKTQEKIPSREDNNIQLLINETNLAKQDKEELNRTGQIKNPRSLHYKKLIPKQSEVKQDNISTEQRNAQLSPLQRPLIYLASPEKVLGDIGVPNMQTSELDRQSVMANAFNENQTREERFLNNAKIGLGYVPQATVNTALAAVFMPEGTGALGLVNETLNPLAGIGIKGLTPHNILPLSSQMTPRPKFSGIPTDLEPFISQYVKPISREEEVFRNVMGTEYENKKLLEDTVYLDKSGNVIPNPSPEPYKPYVEDDYLKEFNEKRKKDKTVIPDERSIIRKSSIIDINDLPTEQQGGTHTDNEKKFIDELVRLKLI